MGLRVCSGSPSGARLSKATEAERKARSQEAMRLSATGTGDVAATALGGLVGSDGGGDADGEAVEAERAQHVLGVGVDLERAGGRGVEGRHLGHVLVLALALLLLQLERDAADGATLDALHEVGGETGDLVAQTLRGDDGDLIDDALVLVEVDARQTRVVLLDEHARGTLGGLGTNATLRGGDQTHDERKEESQHSAWASRCLRVESF